jgi:hypothetical protein
MKHLKKFEAYSGVIYLTMVNDFTLKIKCSDAINIIIDNEEWWDEIVDICKTEEIHGNFGKFTIEFIGDDDEEYDPNFFKKVEKFYIDKGLNVKTNFDEFIFNRDQKKYNL